MGCNNSEISILLTDNPSIRELNREYLSRDRPTDVLSFPMDDDVLLGDVVISIERAVAQATEQSVTKEEEVARLLVHGTLHLLGYDHIHGGRQAAKMKRKEEEVLALLRADDLC